MKRRTKVWLIIAAVLFLIGTIIIVWDFIMIKFDFSKLTTTKYITNTYEIQEAFTDISIQTDTSDVTILQSDGENAKVVCTEDEKMKHAVAVQDGKLVIEVQDTRKWYDHIGINFLGKEKITIYLPDKEYEMLVIKGSTGDIIMKNVIANRSMTIKTSTGDVKFEQCDAPEISIKVSTGDVRGSLLTEKIFIVQTSTGKVKVPKSVTGGKCEVTTSTGNIEINYY